MTVNRVEFRPSRLRNCAPGEILTADCDRRDAAALSQKRFAEPSLRWAVELGFRGSLVQDRTQLVFRESSFALIAERVLLAGTFHGLQIWHVCTPDGDSRLRASAGAGEIDRLDRRAVVGQDLPCRLRNGG